MPDEKFENESSSLMQEIPNMMEDPAERNICDSCQ